MRTIYVANQHIFKRISSAIACLVTLSLLMGMVPISAWAAAWNEFPDDSCVLLLDDQTGETLFEQHADERTAPASTTKLMTALVALDYVGDTLDEQVTVGSEVALTPETASIMGVYKGDVVTWNDLLHGLLIPSGADAALVIATQIGRMSAGDKDMKPEQAIERFVDLMNKKVNDLGLSDTHFGTPHGFDAKGQYTTARDLAKLAQAALREKVISDIVSKQSYTCTSEGGHTITVYNTNWLLDETCEKVDQDGMLVEEGSGETPNPYYRTQCTGVKTGNTEDAGRCLVFTAAQSDMSMMGVLLHFTDRPTLYTHAGAALDGVFEHFGRRDWSVLDKPIAVSVDNPTLRETFSNRTTLSVHTDAPVVTTVDLTEAYTSHVVWDEHYVSEGADGKKHLEHVLIAGAQVATLEITRGDEVVAQVPLYANQSLVPFGSNDMRMLTSLALLAAFLILLVGISIIRALLRRRRRRLLARASIASSHEVADSLPRQSHAQHTAASSDTSHHKPSHMRS